MGQTADPAAESEIVVTARERTIVDQFVQDLTDPARSDQVPRWEMPLCSGVAGLPAKHAVVLNSRIEDVARQVRLTIGKGGCRPNALILVTSNPDAIAKQLRARYPRTLAREGRARLASFAETTQPVRWISQVSELPYDGSPSVPGAADEPAAGRLAGSRLQKSTRAILSGMLVIVDANRLSGLSLGQIGDYLAMVVLARPKMDARAPSGSILSLFGDGTTPGLSKEDRTFLQALYAAPDDVSAKVQRAAMKARMEGR
ncbi:hypothetical protein [Sphingomonas jeddahensis]|nr:hypothetical protein [Sphingomonas jeddahensis]